MRILLGNYPDLGTMQWGSQLYNVLEDLREAGVPELVNEELGWKLEVANFDGQLPHSHTKFLVTDGKTSTAAGFNYSYLHLSPEHPSGLGIGLVDLGLQVHGPIAQSSLVVYDDMWQDADQVVCDSLNPPGDNWERHCDWQKAVADHVPEVLRYAASAEGDANAVDEAFSLYRSTNYLEADEAYAAAISQTEDTLDVFEVNFSLKIYCVLVLIDQSVCDFDDALPWMVSMVDAIEANQVQTRVLITDVNMNGMENAAGVMILMDELEERGLTEYIQIRTYTGRMHSKGVLMDKELLVVGSQNFHYSSWGNSPAALAEYNIATTSPAAIEEFQRTFEYYWEQGRDIADFNGLTFE